MTIGADGSGMHSLHADQSVHVTVRLLKTSPMNAPLAQMYALQTSNPALHGSNTFAVVDTFRGDSVTCLQGAFKKKPTVTYAKVGGMMEWTFDAVVGNVTLGSGG